MNFLQYTEYAADGSILKRFSWVTDLTITRDNARHLVRGGRARWKIENETFNTLKNQGYHFEHNFGHGEQNLSVVFAMLMMLAFLVDQTQELCCPLFQAVHKKVASRQALWDHLRSHFRHCLCQSMQQLQEAILYDWAKELPLPFASSSSKTPFWPSSVRSSAVREIGSTSPRVVQLLVRPEHVVLKIGDQASFSCTGIDQYGQPIAIGQVQWSATGGTMEPSGLFTAGEHGGAFTVKAAAGGNEAHAEVRITTKDETRQQTEPQLGERYVRWRGTIPPQKWMNCGGPRKVDHGFR